MKKPNAQKGERQKERFTLRLDPILAAKIKALSKVKDCSIISIFENALQHYFNQMSVTILLEHNHAEFIAENLQKLGLKPTNRPCIWLATSELQEKAGRLLCLYDENEFWQSQMEDPNNEEGDNDSFEVHLERTEEAIEELESNPKILDLINSQIG